MLSDSFDYRISLQRLLAALILILVPVAVFGLYFALHFEHRKLQLVDLEATQQQKGPGVAA